MMITLLKTDNAQILIRKPITLDELNKTTFFLHISYCFPVERIMSYQNLTLNTLIFTSVKNLHYK